MGLSHGSYDFFIDLPTVDLFRHNHIKDDEIHGLFFHIFNGLFPACSIN